MNLGGVVAASSLQVVRLAEGVGAVGEAPSAQPWREAAQEHGGSRMRAPIVRAQPQRAHGRARRRAVGARWAGDAAALSDWLKLIVETLLKKGIKELFEGFRIVLVPYLYFDFLNDQNIHFLVHKKRF